MLPDRAGKAGKPTRQGMSGDARGEPRIRDHADRRTIRCENGPSAVRGSAEIEIRNGLSVLWCLPEGHRIIRRGPQAFRWFPIDRHDVADDVVVREGLIHRGRRSWIFRQFRCVKYCATIDHSVLHVDRQEDRLLGSLRQNGRGSKHCE
jgi:hypothetical protein